MPCCVIDGLVCPHHLSPRRRLAHSLLRSSLIHGSHRPQDQTWWLLQMGSGGASNGVGRCVIAGGVSRIAPCRTARRYTPLHGVTTRHYALLRATHHAACSPASAPVPSTERNPSSVSCHPLMPHPSHRGAAPAARQNRCLSRRGRWSTFRQRITGRAVVVVVVE